MNMGVHQRASDQSSVTDIRGDALLCVCAKKESGGSLFNLFG